jgi:NAD(P)-dependent dehydrogenase (short-subunit alcohol dehydrogenase family)
VTASVSLEGRVVLVTGSARGIGRGIVDALAASGASVVASVHHGEDAAALEVPGRVVAPKCDVTVRADVDAAVACAVSAFGALDAVVHNAVSNRSNEITDVEHATPALFTEHTSVSVRALLYLAQASYPHLAARRGSFVVMTSPAGIQGTDDRALYAAVKGAQRGFIKSLAREWGRDGPRVNGIAPLAATPALDKAFAGDPGLEARLARVIPLGWFGDPARDIGPTVAFLCSDAARYVTGQTLPVSGGRFTAL